MNYRFKTFLKYLLLFVIVFLIIITFSFLFKILIKNNSDNLNNLFENILGDIISGVITFVVLFITIKHGDKNHKKALNLQSAIQVEANFSNILEKQKEVITESINQLDNLLFKIQNLKVNSVEEISEERKNLINIFFNFQKSMNVIKLNTNIYIDTTKCDGCTECKIKTYGELSKAKTKLRECFNKIEERCNIMFQELQIALNICLDTQNLINQNTEYKKTLSLHEQQIQNYKSLQKMYPNDTEIFEKIKPHELECLKLKDQIKTIDNQIQKLFNDIGTKNNDARNKANEIQTHDRMELNYAAMNYFYIYNLYIRENKIYILKNGTLTSNEKCKKYNFD